jgi:hypothetical protein
MPESMLTLFKTAVFRVLGVITLLFSLLTLIFSPALARQAGGDGTIITFPPDLSLFPSIGFYFGVYDQSGKFINDLTQADIQLLENGHSVPITELVKVQPGIQVTVAINPAPVMGNKLAGVTTIYDHLRTALLQWAQIQPTAASDDYSLSTPAGLQLIREQDPARWAQALQAYQPDFKPAQTTLASLTQALDLGTDPNPNPYMKRSILFVTALPTKEQLTSLTNLTTRAVQLGVHISIWLVAAPNDTTIQQNAIPLADMAKQTGGSFFVYTGPEQLPNYNADLDPIRYLYHLTFNSLAHSGGQQQLGIHIGRPNLDISGPSFTYGINILPPNPIFLTPPTQIKRAPQPNAIGKNFATPVYDPKEITLKALIEFPDGHNRAIKASRLFVDDKMVSENTSPPFDQFKWDLSAYKESASHTLRIEVLDALGITASSIDTPIDIVVDQPQGFSLTRYIPTQGTWIIIALLVAGAVLLIVLVIPGMRSRFGRLNTKKQLIERDPLTQPVKIYQERAPAAAPSPAPPPGPPRLLTGLSAPARLVRLSENGHPMPSTAILLNRREITFGSEAAEANTFLDDASVSPLHARLLYTDGAFIISDMQSVAGTWVNYTPVSTMGVQLEHGDMIHIGRVAFRFELSVPPEQKKPRVISL